LKYNEIWIWFWPRFHVSRFIILCISTNWSSKVKFEWSMSDCLRTQIAPVSAVTIKRRRWVRRYWSFQGVESSMIFQPRGDFLQLRDHHGARRGLASSSGLLFAKSVVAKVPETEHKISTILYNSIQFWEFAKGVTCDCSTKNRQHIIYTVYAWWDLVI